MENIIGHTFGRLLVLDQVETRISPNGTKKYMFKCKCQCGNIKIVEKYSLLNGLTISCGCYSKERASKGNKTHGLSSTRLYKIWQHMKDRCLNQINKDFAQYGGRGITICDEWKNDFQSFAKWAYEHHYTDQLTLDRINVNGNYSPDNCRFATMKMQGHNRRGSLNFLLNGTIMNLSDIAIITEIPYSTLYSRVVSKGMNITDAINIKKYEHRRNNL